MLPGGHDQGAVAGFHCAGDMPAGRQLRLQPRVTGGTLASLAAQQVSARVAYPQPAQWPLRARSYRGSMTRLSEWV